LITGRIYTIIIIIIIVVLPNKVCFMTAVTIDVKLN